MPKGYVNLFQYGSNMDPKRLNSPKRLYGKAKVAGIAQLPGWGVRFDLYSKSNNCAVTDIVPAEGEGVRGIVYKVPVRLVYAAKGKHSRMDKVEGAKPDGTGNYKKCRISVSLKGHACDVVTYVGTVQGRRRFRHRSEQERRVSIEYFGHLLAGAESFKFPDSYKSYLKVKAGTLQER